MTLCYNLFAVFEMLLDHGQLDCYSHLLVENAQIHISMSLLVLWCISCILTSSEPLHNNSPKSPIHVSLGSRRNAAYFWSEQKSKMVTIVFDWSRYCPLSSHDDQRTPACDVTRLVRNIHQMAMKKYCYFSE